MPLSPALPLVAVSPRERESDSILPVAPGRLLDPVVVGVAAAAIGLLFAWVPSLWYDEAATVVSATRSWSALANMLTTVDIVHATYYAGMHLWFDVVGYTPFSLRFPSAVAVGGAAAMTVVLGRMLAGRRVGVLAGIVFCILPRVTWMGLEGRSFACGALLAVASTVLFLTAWRRTRNRTGHPALWWIAYVAVGILGCAVFLYLVLLIVGHGVSALAAVIRDRHRAGASRSAWRSGQWRALRRWGLGACIVAVSIVPLALMASRQSSQIHWIPKPSRHTIEEVFTTQWFYENLPFAIVAWALMLVGVLSCLRPVNRHGRSLLIVAAPWMAVPTVGLIAVSLVHTPLYSPRYVSFATPAAALVMGLGLAAIPWRPVVVILVAGAVGLSVPTVVAQRQVTAKDSSAWNEVAALVSREREREPSGTIEDVIYGPVDRHPLTTSRIIADTYPSAFQGLRDITLREPGADTDHTWATDVPVEDVIGKTVRAHAVWLLTGTSRSVAPTVTSELAGQGFHVDREWSFSRTDVFRYER